jgi:hypothetical protein
VVFQRPEGVGAAARLTYSAPSPTMVDVPFTLRDVPLVTAK